MSFLSLSGENPAFVPVSRPREPKIGRKNRLVRNEQSIERVWPATTSCLGRALSPFLDVNSKGIRVDLKGFIPLLLLLRLIEGQREATWRGPCFPEPRKAVIIVERC